MSIPGKNYYRAEAKKLNAKMNEILKKYNMKDGFEVCEDKMSREDLELYCLLDMLLQCFCCTACSTNAH